MSAIRPSNFLLASNMRFFQSLLNCCIFTSVVTSSTFDIRHAPPHLWFWISYILSKARCDLRQIAIVELMTTIEAVYLLIFTGILPQWIKISHYFRYLDDQYCGQRYHFEGQRDSSKFTKQSFLDYRATPACSKYYLSLRAPP